MNARRILVLHGPNMNLLAGARSIEAIDAALSAKAVSLGVELKTLQSNQEGGLLDALAAERHWFEAVIINPATLAPTAVALAEALELLEKPAIEVQLDDAKKAKSALKTVVEKQIAGKGPAGYLEALVALAPKGGAKGLGARVVSAAVMGAGAAAVKSASVVKVASPAKSIGRESAKETVGRVLPSGEILKSIGPKARTLPKKQPLPSAPPSKSIGGQRAPAVRPGVVSRALVRQQIADRLSGTITPAGLATWSRSEWQKLQNGAPAESGQRDQLEDVLQQLLLSASSRPTDEQLIELMTQLGE